MILIYLAEKWEVMSEVRCVTDLIKTFCTLHETEQMMNVPVTIDKSLLLLLDMYHFI